MIEQKAREIVASQYPEMRPSYKERRLTIARLGIIEGRRQAFEEAAKVAERIGACSNTTGRSNCCEQTGEDIADAIRALIGDKK